MFESRIGSLATAPHTPRASYEGQIKPERFTGMAELRLAKPLSLTQFGVNHVRLEPERGLHSDIGIQLRTNLYTCSKAP